MLVGHALLHPALPLTEQLEGGLGVRPWGTSKKKGEKWLNCLWKLFPHLDAVRERGWRPWRGCQGPGGPGSLAPYLVLLQTKRSGVEGRVVHQKKREPGYDEKCGGGVEEWQVWRKGECGGVVRWMRDGVEERRVWPESQGASQGNVRSGQGTLSQGHATCSSIALLLTPFI